jgi:hypothetical protein
LAVIIAVAAIVKALLAQVVAPLLALFAYFLATVKPLIAQIIALITPFSAIVESFLRTRIELRAFATNVGPTTGIGVELAGCAACVGACPDRGISMVLAT